MDGKRLGEVDLLIEDNASVRKVRRIMEKRISQDYWKTRSTGNGNGDRQCMRRHLSNQMKNIWGGVPSGFHYCAWEPWGNRDDQKKFLFTVYLFLFVTLRIWEGSLILSKAEMAERCLHNLILLRDGTCGEGEFYDKIRNIFRLFRQTSWKILFL